MITVNYVDDDVHLMLMLMMMMVTTTTTTTKNFSRLATELYKNIADNGRITYKEVPKVAAITYPVNVTHSRQVCHPSRYSSCYT